MQASDLGAGWGGLTEQPGRTGDRADVQALELVARGQVAVWSRVPVPSPTDRDTPTTIHRSTNDQLRAAATPPLKFSILNDCGAGDGAGGSVWFLARRGLERPYLPQPTNQPAPAMS